MTEAGNASTDINEIREGVFHFEQGDRIYRDHFPGYPVVPGSLIIQAFLTAGNEIWRDVGVDADMAEEGFTIENFRFREFLFPGLYPYRIERKENALHCTISRTGKSGLSMIGRTFQSGSKDNKKLVTGVLKR